MLKSRIRRLFDLAVSRQLVDAAICVTGLTRGSFRRRPWTASPDAHAKTFNEIVA